MEKRRTKQRKQQEENENSAPSAPSRTARAQTRAPPRTDPSSAPYRLCGPLRPCPGSAEPGDAGPLGGARPRPQQRPRPKRGGEPEAPCPQPRPRTATSQDRTRTQRSLTACDRPTAAARGNTSLPARPATARKCFLLPAAVRKYFFPPSASRKYFFPPSASRKCFLWPLWQPWGAVGPVPSCRAMAQAALGSAGLHFDELNKLRVLDPDVAQQTAQLREECKAFVDSECCAPGPGRGALHFPPRSAKSPDRACALRGLGAERRLAVIVGAFVSCGVVLGTTWLFFFSEIVEFQKTVGSLIELVDQLAKAAESEKMKVPCRYGLSCLPLLAVCVCEKPPVPSCHSTAALSASYGHSRGPICVQCEHKGST